VSEVWFNEVLHRGVGQRLSVDEVLYEGRTKFQDVQIFRNPRFGKVMTLDGVVQTTEGDEFVYHEMFAHVPLLAHGSARSVLIVGGGDGGLLEEVLKHKVEHVTEVELDAGVVEISREHLASICGNAYDDPRVELVIGDGAKFVAETDQKYDIVLVDSTDPIGPGAVLFTHEFYANCKRCMNPDGILVTQNGVPFMQGDELVSSVAHFRSLFRDRAAFVISCPTYALGFMALGWATDDADLRWQSLETVQARFDALGIDTRYYNPQIHVAAFALPTYMRALIDKAQAA
jgi:spermidine synthase